MRISVSCSRAALVSFRASSSSRSVVHRPSFGSGWTSRSYARDVSPDRSILRTVFRDTRRSRAICLIVLPLTKCSRRIRPIVSTASIPPPPASNQSEQRIRPNWRGSILDADNPLQGVKIARRITPESGTSVPATILPGTGIPIFPMRDLVLFPQMITPIFVGRDKTRRAVEGAMGGDRRVLVVAQRRGADNDPNTLESLYPVCVTASVVNRQTQVDGVLKVSVCGLQRTAIVRLINDEFLSAEVVPIEEGRGQSAEAATLSRAVLDAYQIYANVDFSSLPQAPSARFGLPSIGDPSLLPDQTPPLLQTSTDQNN